MHGEATPLSSEGIAVEFNVMLNENIDRITGKIQAVESKEMLLSRLYCNDLSCKIKACIYQIGN